MAYTRKSYLIDLIFQAKFALFVAFLIAISNILYPIAIYFIFGSQMDLISEKVPEIANAINASQKELLRIIVLWQLCFLALSFIVSAFFSHKIAGPIYKIQKTFSLAIKKGLSTIYLRKGDFFTPLADGINNYTANREHNLKLLQQKGTQLESLKSKLNAADQELLTKFLEDLNNSVV